MKPIRFRINAQQFAELHQHLFPGDDDEHGAVLLAGLCETDREMRFIVRDVLLAADGVDYVPSKRGYRMLTADFVARASHRSAQEKLCYFAVHCHGGCNSVAFSDTDVQSHRRGYPALLDITSGGPVGALVLAKNAVAGEIWTRQGVRSLTSMTVVGLNQHELFPDCPKLPKRCEDVFHRQSLLFGDVGQERLRDAKVGIIGLGGVGSLINELVARLGVGEIVAVDYDKLEPSNRSRVVGSRRLDTFDWLRNSHWKMLRHLGNRWARPKVHVAARVAREANPDVRYHAVVGDIIDEAVARRLTDSDYLFLCADTMQSRLVFNALVHQYMIPGVQIGSKVPVDEEGTVGEVFSVARLVLPEPEGGCLICNQLIVASNLQDEAISPEERERQAYVKEIKAPSVITLNAMGAAQAANDFLFCLLGLFDSDQAKAGYRTHFARARRWMNGGIAQDELCRHCGINNKSIYGRGDRSLLPCRD